jgi:hypothetical protein
MTNLFDDDGPGNYAKRRMTDDPADLELLAAVPGGLSDDAKRLRWRRGPDLPAAPGAPPVRAYRADAADGPLAAACAREPVGRDGRPLWHLSVSHAARLPSWDELKAAKYQIVPEDVVMVLVFPRRAAAYVNLHPNCLHLWEAEPELDQ